MQVFKFFHNFAGWRSKKVSSVNNMIMKQTKRLITAIVLLTMSLTSCDDKPISAEQIPAAAQTYIKENYPDSKILIAKKGYERFSATYEVKLDNGLELTFDSDGVLTDVDD